MYVVCVTIRVKEGCVERFLEAIRDNHICTRRDEPNNVRFDVLRHEDEPGRFFLYEVYKSREDFAAHQRTPHYLRWKDAAADMMASPREAAKHHCVFPENGGW
jgi:autoinducer 2-degrading protein